MRLQLMRVEEEKPVRKPLLWLKLKMTVEWTRVVSPEMVKKGQSWVIVNISL